MTERLVSHSEFAIFRHCRRRWYLQFVRRLVPKSTGEGSLRLGQLTHTGMEVLYRGGVLEHALDAIRDQVETSLSPDLDPAPQRALGQTAQTFLIGYWEWLRETGADQRYEHVAEEEVVSMPLTRMEDGTLWVLRGKLDRRVHDRLVDQVRFMDFKTVSDFDQFMALTPRDEQFPTYEMLLRYAHPGERVGHGVWRMIKKRKRARDGDAEFFRDHEVSINDHVMESVRRRYVAMAEEMHEITTLLQHGADHRDVVYPNPTFSCTWSCPYVGVCDMFDDGSRVESALNVLYERGNPYAHYDTFMNDVTEETEGAR